MPAAWTRFLRIINVQQAIPYPDKAHTSDSDLRPGDPSLGQAEAVRARLEEPGMTAEDIDEAIDWARK